MRVRSFPRPFLPVLAAAIAVFLGPRGLAQLPADSTFTYQGAVRASGVPVTGTCDLNFSLWDSLGSGMPPVGGTQIGSTVARPATPVTGGIFTVSLSFGATAFDGNARYLMIDANCNGAGAFTLAPRQPLTPAPYAMSLIPNSSMAVSVSGDVFAVHNSGSGDAINGYHTGSGRGVYASSESGIGAYGLSNSGVGVQGASGGDGVRGKHGLSGLSPSFNSGVWGDASGGYGVAGTSDNHPGVYAKSTSDDGLQAFSTSASGVYARSENGVGLNARSTNGNPIEAYGFDGGNRRFYVSNAGNVFADGSFNGGGADLAERINVLDRVEAGDVVEIDPTHADRFRRSRRARSRLVAGVVSTAPGVTMNNADLAGDDTGLGTDDRPLLALVGKVPVKATTQNGPIRIGDLLVSSSKAGRVMRAGRRPAEGTVVGKALGALEKGDGSVLMLVKR
ncbi:MAG TPA: hypothetical protein VGR00_01745 [Thermoanaerobaculia bacterium]|nr:hypothetical protein [Thermoanaerobaculia bacterium]